MREGTLFVFDGTVLDMMQVYDDLDNFIMENEYDVRAFWLRPLQRAGVCEALG